jgi:anti-sigma B factor antagonist
MAVQTRPVRDNLVIDVKGQVDLHTSPRMRLAILTGINRKDVSRVAVNLAGVNYIDSSGVATLIEGLQLARKRDCRFVLFGLRQEAREVLMLAHLDRIFEIRATEADALKE